MPLWPLGESARGKNPTPSSAVSPRTAGPRSWSARKTTKGIISSVASPSEPESNASKLWRLSAMTLSICASRECTSPSHGDGDADGDGAGAVDVVSRSFFPHPADIASTMTKAALAPRREVRMNFMADLRTGRLTAAPAVRFTDFLQRFQVFDDG